MIYKFFKHKIFHKWIFQNPNSENRKAVSEFNKWLKEHKDDYCEMYHGTDASLPILKNGLKKTSSRTKRSYQSQSGYVYLSIYPSMAKTFGEMGYPQKKINVYAVKIKISELKADTDQLNNKRMWSEIKKLGNTLAESLNVGSGARIKRNILPSELRIIKPS